MFHCVRSASNRVCAQGVVRSFPLRKYLVNIGASDQHLKASVDEVECSVVDASLGLYTTQDHRPGGGYR